LKQRKNDYEQVAVQRQTEIKRLQADARDAQLIEYLRRKRLETAAISDIGPVRKDVSVL
jgi:hypothetical protein